MATPQACERLLVCLEALQSQQTSKPATLHLKRLDPMRERKISGGLRFQDFARVKIYYRLVTPELQQMCISDAGEEAVIETTETKMEALRFGIEEMRRGNGDFSIGPRRSRRDGLIMGDYDKKSLSLWFWPFNS